ncbi:sigma factor [Pseudomonas benzenivorans]|uniref:RNA polymerase sigma-70 region 2 domain-containing protein n=1 Tax=Pseudomonas benzenivorans TaxID=556533 RepID=A0ABY5H467_9PSED|nr:sigma factor [Pseudomonas benzenivorans]UTW06864.1 hypothetical protein KDW96_17105 [Pseudomonas benzenivorans]
MLPDPMRSAAAAAAIQGYLTEIGYCPPLAAAEECYLMALARGGDEGSGARLVECHRSLVARLALHCEGRGVPLPALIEAGRRGMVQAVASYDPDSGCGFSIYGAWWVGRSIEHAVQRRTGSMHLPLAVARKLYRYLCRQRGQR